MRANRNPDVDYQPPAPDRDVRVPERQEDEPDPLRRDRRDPSDPNRPDYEQPDPPPMKDPPNNEPARILARYEFERRPTASLQ